MRSLWFGVLVCAAMFVACGDDESDFAARPSDDSLLSSSSAKSSGSVYRSGPCKTETEDNCEYGELVDERDGQTYKTVKIGDQVWMAENLNFETDSSFCYKDSAEYCEQYGRLYTWAAAMDSAGTWSTNGMGCGDDKTCSPTYPVRGVCPDGWHLPDTTEWKTLFATVDGKSVKLKFQTGWNNDGNGTDDFGFSALPAGNRAYYGDYKRGFYVDYFNEGNGTYFWSSIEYASYSAYYISLNYEYRDVRLGYYEKENGYSIRCVKDSDDEFSSSVTPKSSDSETSVSSSSTKSSSSSVYIRVPCDVETDENCFEDARDGQTYRTVQIGSRVWMAENLNYETANSYCYNDSAEYCEKYGRLYTWAAAMDSAGTWSANGKGCGYNKTCSPTYPVRGVCPDGWHLPAQTEWNSLFSAVGGQSNAGKKLKFTSGWNENGNGKDAFSFSALPAGARYRNGDYHSEGDLAYFWSSTESASLQNAALDANYMNLGYYYDDAHLNIGYKYLGYSVRCVKDSDDGSSSSVKNESSSSVTLSSSSSDINIIEESSSSADSSNSSSSDSEKSSSSVGEAGWSWDVPKESRFNPDIIYGTMTDSRDKKVYKTVKIGDQVWMAENLNYADSIKTPSLLERSWCYDNVAANCDVAGRLYTWAAAIDSVKLATDADNPQDCGFRKTCTLPDTVYGICPPGWHLPTQTEWETLLTEVGGLSTASKILKSQTGWYENGNGTDGVGFSALPAGGWDVGNSEFFAGGRLANFWSASGDYTSNFSAYHMDLSYEDDHANLTGYYKKYGFSVRCLKDDP